MAPREHEAVRGEVLPVQRPHGQAHQSLHYIISGYMVTLLIDCDQGRDPGDWRLLVELDNWEN